MRFALTMVEPQSRKEEETMLRKISIIAILGLAAGCSATKKTVQVFEDNNEIVTVLPAYTPPILLGDPIYNAEMATFLAEFVLAGQGIDCRNRRPKVSYCEGVYTVAFLPAKEKVSASRLLVDIDADTSTILSVTIRKDARPKIPKACTACLKPRPPPAQ